MTFSTPCNTNQQLRTSRLDLKKRIKVSFLQSRDLQQCFRLVGAETSNINSMYKMKNHETRHLNKNETFDLNINPEIDMVHEFGVWHWHFIQFGIFVSESTTPTGHPGL